MNRRERYQRDLKILKAREKYPQPTFEELAEKFHMTPSGVFRALNRLLKRQADRNADKIGGTEDVRIK